MGNLYSSITSALSFSNISAELECDNDPIQESTNIDESISTILKQQDGEEYKFTKVKNESTIEGDNSTVTSVNFKGDHPSYVQVSYDEAKLIQQLLSHVVNHEFEEALKTTERLKQTSCK